VVGNQNSNVFTLHSSKEVAFCAIFDSKINHRFPHWTFIICPILKSSSTFIKQNMSSFFLVPFFQLMYNNLFHNNYNPLPTHNHQVLCLEKHIHQECILFYNCMEQTKEKATYSPILQAFYSIPHNPCV